SVLNNYLRDMTTNYKTSFLLPHDYEVPTFNYPQYVFPPMPYNYKPYTKDIWNANTIQPLKTKITAPAQCKPTNSSDYHVNLFSDEFNSAYYEVEIDLRQIDPTIQSISKFQDAYKTIEISNMSNLQIECGPCDIENFIPNRNVNILAGYSTCEYNFGSLNNVNLQESGHSQTDKANFENIITLYTDNIKNDIQTFATAYTNGLPSKNYYNIYNLAKNTLLFVLKITKWSINDKDKIKETHLQAYYTNDVKLKIRFSKTINANLKIFSNKVLKYRGNDKNIRIDVNNWGTLGIRNKSINSIKITIKPR
ncbi:hypothetical protein, partial [Spiroplasma sp. ald]|uniref:hypothetical protein n=1 Tax=Spiroplasma sp. ald TaxID=2490849 RepID=UPI0037DCCC1C